MQLSEDDFRRLGYQAVDMAAAYLSGLPGGAVFRRMTEEQRQALTQMPMPPSPIAGEEILQIISERILPYPMGNGHPRFFGWVNSPPAAMAVITEILAAAMNPSCAGGDHAGVYLEHCVVRWLMEMLSFPVEGSAGHLVSGGSAASLTALAAARTRVHRRLGIDVRRQGVAGKLRLYASTQVHSCVQKAVELLGMGSDSIRWISTDADFRISMDELRLALRDDASNGWRPFCIVANAGSVHTGAIDPLDALAALAEQEDLWLHVDGAYGAAGILDPAARPLFAGIERADSIALDPHKWLSTPIECGCVLVRDGALLRSTFALVPSYLQTEAGKGAGNLPWFSEFSLQQTRAFRSLKLWVTLAHTGRANLEGQISRQIALARYLERRIEAIPGLELLSRGKLSIVCFRLAPSELAGNEEALQALNKRVMERVQENGEAFITGALLHGRFALRACILHYGAEEKDIDAMLASVLACAEECRQSSVLAPETHGLTQ